MYFIVTNYLSSPDIFSENSLRCMKYTVVQPALYNPIVQVTFYGTKKISEIFPQFTIKAIKIIKLILKSNRKALFCSINRSRAVIDAIVIQASRRYAGHRKPIDPARMPARARRSLTRRVQRKQSYNTLMLPVPPAHVALNDTPFFI